jgi:gamma-glutamyltranspeptidase/glutathione hydrolase
LRTLLILLLAITPATPALAFDPAPAASAHGMVATAQHLATDVGVDVLKQGGNAVDAAVAIGYALAVTYPAAGNLGGGGFMTVRMADGTAGFLDFREKAPAAATATMFLDAQGAVVKGRSTDTWLAIAIPGTPAGLEAARLKWGHLDRATLLAPAIRLARDGFVVEAGDAGLLALHAAQFAQDPGMAAAFLHDGKPYATGERLAQPDLAHTLEMLAGQGPDAFYRGPIADAVAAASERNGGIIQRADFAAYKVRDLPPVTCTYRGIAVISAPPPSSGGVTLCETLGILQGYDLAALGFHSAASVHIETEALRQAYYDRNNRLGDPDFVHNPTDELLAPAYAARIRTLIDPAHARPSAQVALLPHEGDNTTSYAVVDQAGNAVSVTYTLNDWFGAKRMAPGTGVVLNNEMDDFTAKPGAPNAFGLVQGTANAVAPGKTPLSSMAPTILVRDGRTVMALGSPGGARIITIVLNVILDAVDYGMTVQEAVDAPRIHHQWLPDTIYAERFALSPDTKAALVAMGHSVTEQAPWGIAEAITLGKPRLGPEPPGNSAQSLILVAPDSAGATRFGAHDPRGGAGSAAGY